MTNAELARALASRENVSIDHAACMLRTICLIAREELVAGRPVTLGTLGTLKPSASGTRFRPSRGARAMTPSTSAPNETTLEA